MAPDRSTVNTWPLACFALVVVLVGCGEIVGLGPKRTLAEGNGGSAAGGAGGGGGDGAGGTAGGGGVGPHMCNPDGDVLWLRTFGDASYDYVGSLAPDGEGGVYISGWFAGAIDLGGGPIVSAGERDMFVARLNADGELLWANHYGTINFDEIGPSLTLHPQGVVLCGTNFTSIDFGAGLHNSNAHDAYVTLLSPEGERIWERWVDGPGEQRCWGGGVAVDPATHDVVMPSLFGDAARAGGNTFVGQGEGDILLVRLAAADGTVTDTRTFASTEADRPQGLDIMPNGRIVMSASTRGSIDLGSGPLPNNGNDVMVALLQPNLATVWGHVFAFPGDQEPWRPKVTSTGDIIVSGSMSGSIDLGAGTISDTAGGFIARLSASDGLATSSMGLPGFNYPTRALENAAGDVIIAGGYVGLMTVGGQTESAAGQADAQADPAAFKLSADLQQVLWKQLASTSTHWEDFTGMALDTASNVFLSGSFHDTLAIEGCSPRVSAGDKDGFLMKRRP